MRFLILWLAFAASLAYADDSRKFTGYHLIDVEYLDARYQKFDYARDPYTPEYDGKWLYRAALDLRLNVLEFLYWDNNIHTEAIDSATVKTVGWHWEAGARVTSSLKCYHEHHSRHIMDESPERKNSASNVFPVEDSWGCGYTFIDRPPGRSIGGWISP